MRFGLEKLPSRLCFSTVLCCYLSLLKFNSTNTSDLGLRNSILYIHTCSVFQFTEFVLFSRAFIDFSFLLHHRLLSAKKKIDSSLMFGKFYSYADMCNGCGPLPKNCHTLHVTWWAASLKGQCGGQGHVRGIVKSNPKSLKVTTLRRDRQAGQLPSRLDIRICLRNRNSILKYLCLEGIGSKESRDAVPF